MSTLNRDAAHAMMEVGIHTATDVTGFGLLGHLSEMLREPGLGARLSVAAIPLLSGARELAGSGVAPGGTRKNLDAVSGRLSVADDVTETDRLLLADAQTSGGLLIAVSPERRDDLLEKLSAGNVPCAAEIGEITASSEIRIEA
jgi:selenide,water dikinase